MKDLQPKSHPLKWRWLQKCVADSGMEDPDVWIEDLRPPHGPPEPSVVEVSGKDTMDETPHVEASFSVITWPDKNRVIIRTHY